MSVQAQTLELKPETAAAPAVPASPSSLTRILRFVRFWLNVRANVTVVLHNQAQIATALQNLAAHQNRQNARLDYWAHTVPLIGQADAKFRAHERKLINSAEAQSNYEEREKRRSQLEVVGK